MLIFRRNHTNHRRNLPCRTRDHRRGNVPAAIIAGLLLCALVGSRAAAELPEPTLVPPFATADLKLGESQTVTLQDGQHVSIKLLDLREERDPVRGAVRRAEVDVQVNDQKVTLVSGNYRLPVSVAGVRVDCPVTVGYAQNGRPTTADMDAWGLEKDARFRVWPAGGELLNHDSFSYPARQRWFAGDTQMANEPTFVDDGERPNTQSVYYHYGLDIGGAEEHVDVVAATDGLVVSVGRNVLPGYEGTPVATRYDVVYVLDDRGWFYRYSHLYSIDATLQPGKRIRREQPIGLLGKEGGSGGWSHLHFDISGRQPSGKWGIIEGYAFLWEAYIRENKPTIIAVARPHYLALTGEEVKLDGSRSWSATGEITSYEWTGMDGEQISGATISRRYSQPGVYSEVLKVTDRDGQIDYDFAVVHVLDQDDPERLPPSINANYSPTQGIKAGDPVTFRVRTFRTTDGEEAWDFGDGSSPVTVQSDGNVDQHAKDGYAKTEHRFEKPGIYLVRVSRTNAAGLTATARLKVVVEK